MEEIIGCLYTDGENFYVYVCVCVSMCMCVRERGTEGEREGEGEGKGEREREKFPEQCANVEQKRGDGVWRIMCN